MVDLVDEMADTTLSRSLGIRMDALMASSNKQSVPFRITMVEQFFLVLMMMEM